MNVLIFAAGLGTRLKPITDSMPKALVPIDGKPLLGILIEKLKRQLASDKNATLVVNIHHFAQQIIKYLHTNENFGLDIRISDERDMLLETGGGMKKALGMFDDEEPALVHNVDILTNLNIIEFYGRAFNIIKEQSSRIGAVLEVSHRKSSRYLLFDDKNKLCGWTNINTGEIKSPYPTLDISKLRMLAFSGIQTVNPTIIKPFMESWDGKFSIVDFYLSICDKTDIRCEENDDLSLVDVGKLETLDYLCRENINSLL